MKKLNFVEKLKVVWKHLKQGIAISPSFQGDPTIFHKEIFLKQTPHINLLPSLNLRVLASSHLVQTAKKKERGRMEEGTTMCHNKLQPSKVTKE